MHDAVILNAGSGAWAFEQLALSLSRAFEVPASNLPASKNYLLGWHGDEPPQAECFVPFESIRVATDKRLIERAFAAYAVPRPQTHLLGDEELPAFLAANARRRWLLKYPIGCGGAGHRFLEQGNVIPFDWPRPLVVQEFIALACPKVFRLYGVAGELFGANVRRFAGEAPTPFVAHARGARYADAGELCDEAVEVARRALQATGLLSSFGCVDLLCDDRGRWLALEVGTDGLWNHVDRDLALPSIEAEIEARLAHAFAAWSLGEVVLGNKRR